MTKPDRTSGFSLSLDSSDLACRIDPKLRSRYTVAKDWLGLFHRAASVVRLACQRRHRVACSRRSNGRILARLTPRRRRTHRRIHGIRWPRDSRHRVNPDHVDLRRCPLSRVSCARRISRRCLRVYAGGGSQTHKGHTQESRCVHHGLTIGVTRPERRILKRGRSTRSQAEPGVPMFIWPWTVVEVLGGTV